MCETTNNRLRFPLPRDGVVQKNFTLRNDDVQFDNQKLHGDEPRLTNKASREQWIQHPKISIPGEDLHQEPMNDVGTNQCGATMRTNEDDHHSEITPVPKMGFLQLFRFSDCLDKCLMFIGLLSAWIAGLCMPIALILYGRLSNALVQYGVERQLEQCPNNLTAFNHTINWLHSGQNSAADLLHQESIIFVIRGIVVGAVQLTLGYVMVACFNAAAERQVYRIRSLFLRSTLRQEIGWFDTKQCGDLTSGFTVGFKKLQDGIGEKFALFNFFVATSAFEIINAFVHGWKLTLVLLSVTPVTVVTMAIIGKIQSIIAEEEQKAYSMAGSIVEEVLAAIRTVVSFGGQDKEVERYDAKLDHVTKAGIRRGLITAGGSSVFWFIYYATFGLAFWYGVKLIGEQRGHPNPEYDPSIMIIVYFCVLLGSMNIGRSAPYIDAFAQAKAAAAFIYNVIERVPPIDSSSEDGMAPTKMIGNVELDSVYFNYPNRSEIKILDGIKLQIAKGETVALVGGSGCGKSTVIHLLQRFYDPIRGCVLVDGHDIRMLNLGWLRDNIGIVGQEPVLFSTTIAENIKYGVKNATMEDVIKAAKQANAHDFISELPKKYDTLVGDGGTQLSGGQKQRVAIARALIKNPKILLLDEATSALDSESEAVVQHALEKARQGRTTIIVAHRLSTVQNADRIAVMSGGQIKEIGTHEELMAYGGLYHAMVNSQSTGTANNGFYETGYPSQKWLSSGEINAFTQIAVSGGNEIPNDDATGETMSPSSSIIKLLKVSRPEWHLVALGCLGAFGMGLGNPIYAILFGSIMSVLANCDQDRLMEESTFYVYMFLVLGLASAIFAFLQIFMFSYSGEILTRRLRKMAFAAMLKQEMGFFDDPKNSIGTLCTRLSSDSTKVQGAGGSVIGIILQSICSLIVSPIISLFLCWKMALVGICAIPLILTAAYIQWMIIMGQSAVEMKSLDKANKIAVEVISNIRTVASLHAEAAFYTKYMQNLAEPHRKAVRSAHLRGLVFGFAQSIQYFIYSAGLFYGGYLVLNEELDYGAVFKISELLIIGTVNVGHAFAFAPNASEGAVSAARIFLVLERKPKIDSSLDFGITLPETSQGGVAIRGVSFRYPARPNVPVLRELNLTVEPEQVLALVGSSGCGKSTCIQLLQRFYDPNNGCVMMDDIDIRRINGHSLRSHIGVVSQEPILFNRSIAENIAYGDNSRDVPMDEIIKAATDANINQFIAALPEGYQTAAGNKGSQLSGGQKQRIAIARALVRNPKILLLDEATSALDTENEKVVQEALERAKKGRTCIVVAHRLSTIRNADQIAVIHQGKVAEKGSHEELMALRGLYYKFYQKQTEVVAARCMISPYVN